MLLPSLLTGIQVCAPKCPHMLEYPHTQTYHAHTCAHKTRMPAHTHVHTCTTRQKSSLLYSGPSYSSRAAGMTHTWLYLALFSHTSLTTQGFHMQLQELSELNRIGVSQPSSHTAQAALLFSQLLLTHHSFIHSFV